MDSNETIQEILNENNGFITSTQATEAGVQRRVLSALVVEGRLYRVERGIYVRPDIWEDEMFFLQYRFSKGIFSHETALYLHGLSDRTPLAYKMTFPHGYNATGVKKSGVAVKFALLDNYHLGITEMASPCGNPIRTYDKERTLCDIVKGKNATDIQIINHAMKAYAGSPGKDIAMLLSYAVKLRVKPKILRYMEVLL